MRKAVGCWLQFCATLAVVIGVAAAMLGSALLAEEWPQWRGIRSNGEWKGPKLPEKWPENGLPVAWKHPIGGGYAGVSVARGRAYTMDYRKTPREVERVLCFEAATGRQLWIKEYPVQYGMLDYGNGPRAAPTIHDGKVYTLGAVGHARCFDAASGDVLWSQDFTAHFGAKLPEWGLAASPVIWKDLAIFHPGAKPGGSLLAVDRKTGKEVWRASDDPAGYCTPILVQSPSGEQLIAWTPEHIHGIAPGTGKILWSFPYKVTYGVSIATPIYHRGLVFVSGYWEGSKAIRLGDKPEQAELVWEDRRNLRGLMSQPLSREGYVYSLDKEYGLTCFEIAQGKKLWDDDHRMTPQGRNPQASLVWLGDEDRAIVLNSEGELILARLNPKGYQEQSRTKIIGPTWAHPAYADDLVIARDDKEIVCVKLPTAAKNNTKNEAK